MAPEQIDTRGWGSEDDWRPPHFDCDRPDRRSWRHHLLFEEEDDDDSRDVRSELDDYNIPEELRRFAEQHRIADYLATSIDLAAKYFVGGVRIMRLEGDPDNSADQWIAIRVAASGSIADTLDREDSYSTEFLRLVPWPEREKIRLEYRFCEDDEAARVL